MRMKLLSCEVLYREMCNAISRSPHQVDIQFFSKGLHDLGGPAMREHLQAALDAVDPTQYDTVLLGFALCGNGAAGLRATSIPFVMPRAHDCITLLMGSHQRYLEYFRQHQGVYFRSTGWLERGETTNQPTIQEKNHELGMGYDLAELIKRYGDENGRYLFEQLNTYQQTYTQLTFIETGIEPNSTFEDKARVEAERRGWKFEKIEGDLSMFEKLVSGDWDEKLFLVVPPGYRVVPTYDDLVIRAEEASGT